MAVDERKGDGTHAADALQIAAESSLDEQRQRAQNEDAQIDDGLAGDCGIDTDAGEEQRYRGDA